ncbi:MAG: hypothetical protein IJ007_05105 [Oscillospiraceae bacterium]|nr:hypothetical protein [Oscillospiraceae bacterium]
MKRKEQYRRIKVAKSEWINTFGLDPSAVRTIPCTEKLIQRLTEKYRIWTTVENSHCCYGWRRCCWVDAYERNNFFSDDDAKVIAEGEMLGCRKLSRTSPIFHICEKGKRVYILITYRHMSGKDFLITGVADRETQELWERIFREVRR